MQFWSPHYREDEEALEWAQKRSSKILLRLEYISYQEKSDKLGLFHLHKLQWKCYILGKFNITKAGKNLIEYIFQLLGMNMLCK